MANVQDSFNAMLHNVFLAGLAVHSCSTHCA